MVLKWQLMVVNVHFKFFAFFWRVFAQRLILLGFLPFFRLFLTFFILVLLGILIYSPYI